MSGTEIDEKSLTGKGDNRSPAKLDVVNPWDPTQFPDGGAAAWLVVAGAFCCVFCSFGWVNCIGIFQDYYQGHQLREYSPSTISWIASLELFVMFAGRPIVGRLYDKYGPRYILAFGTFFQIFGLMMTSISSQYYQFILAQGVCSPIGMSCLFTPSTNCVSTWFFTDSRYTYTRWASIAASKTIIREADVATADVERPAFWHVQAHIVGAGITLCLDILHRSRDEPEFAEHKRLVDQAVAFLKRYDDSTLAVRGMRLLSSLLEGAAKQQPPKHHARHDEENKVGPHEGNPLAWPLEDRQSIDAMWASRKSNSVGDGSQSVVSPAISLQQEPQLRTIPTISIARNAGGLDVPTQDADDFNSGNGSVSFDAVSNNGGLLDASWWTDFFSDYFPAQSGFENSFLIEDLVNLAP